MLPVTPLRVGFVGCGKAATELHLRALARVEGAEAVAVADADARRAREVGERFGLRGAMEDADLVAVCTPPRHHAEIALRALRDGRHVLVEKPLTLDLDEADALVEAAASSGLVGAVGFNLRVHRQVVAARAALAAGRLGRLLMVRTHWSAGARAPGWRAAGGEGGAALWEMGIHHLDLWRVLGGGEPRDVAATGDDAAIALSARTDGGIVLSSTIVSGTGDAHEVELVGDRGRMTLTLFRGDGPRLAPAGEAAGGAGPRLRAAVESARDLPRQARAARAGGDYALSFVAQWEALRDAIAGGGPPPATFADGRAAVALAVEAEAALAREGARV